METIKAVIDLPNWFSAREYNKSLSAVDWYREIRSRTAFPLLRKPHFEGTKRNRESIEQSWKVHIAVSDWRRNPQSTLFEIDQNNNPIDDLSIFEAFFLSESVCDPKLVAFKGNMSKLLAMWRLEL